MHGSSTGGMVLDEEAPDQNELDSDHFEREANERNQQRISEKHPPGLVDSIIVYDKQHVGRKSSHS